MKKLVLSLLITLPAFAASPKHWVTVDSQILGKLAPMQKALMVEKEGNGVSLIQLSDEEIDKLSSAIHNELHRCGGFISHDSEAEALLAFVPRGDMHFAMKGVFSDHDIDQQELVEPMVKQVSAKNIEKQIREMSNFHNRYYTADTGSDSQNFVMKTWKSLSNSRSDIKVDLFKHSKFPQPSVVMTIEGSDYPNEIIIMGGHADSIAGGWFGGPKSRAPGADDNASGISTLTEAMRIALANNFKPKRTIMFMAYAAEEVGLLGSKDIASTFKSQGKNVVGVLQYDMTLRKGTANKDIVMMTDYTNTAQNEFIGRLIDEYVKVPWGYSKCGYGCSDHASWTNNGFPASIPFESTMEDINHAIHTDKDTIETAGGNADHAAKFAKLAIAYMVELAN
ncbi:MAG: M20/M25/M40 family metallo-hydrolase [Bacteriovoracaceae bacterium]|nr:M20/M25/M40 family metallo-hydrolase [Bacteriovoracaceae bacterium]